MNRSDSGQRFQGVDHAAVEQREVAGVQRDGDVRRRPEQAIEHLVRDPHRERRDSAHADPVDDVPALEPLLVELGDQLGRDPAGRRRAGSTASPVAMRMPLVNALCEPKFRVWLIDDHPGRDAASSASTSRALSGLASLTKMIS